MTRIQLTTLAASGSAALLLGAFAYQLLGYAPCTLCIWQRYPHVAAVVIGVAAWALGHRAFALLGAVAAVTTAAIGFYHAGVELGWFTGPTTCTSGAIGDLSPDALLDQIMEAPLVRCDDIAWQFLGLSMAAWNGVLSLALAALWLAAYRRT
ncbi:MAG: disulfide bond formation protein B [Pseudomonadota bacterium]